MANIKEHFDINQIIGIKFHPERSAGYSWVEAEPEKRIFFGLIPWRYGRPAGFTDAGSPLQWIYTEEDLKSYGYKVYSFDERINDRVCEKPYVVVYLAHELQISKKFETDSEAEEWVDQLKEKSGKSFEVIKH